MKKIILLIALCMFLNATFPMKRDFDDFLNGLALEAGASKRQQTDLDQALLRDAGSCGCMVRDLLDQGADINARDDIGRTSLMRAVLQNFGATVALLIERGANVNIKDNFSGSALLYAVALEHTDLVNALLDAGAFVDSSGYNGTTPLMCAAECGYDAIAQLLIDRGAQVNVQDYSGWTALMYAVEADERDMVQLLLAHDADVERGAWHGVCMRPLLIAAQQGNAEIAGQLISHGADIEARTVFGWTPLGLAVNHGRHQAVELLLERGADINFPITAGQAALAKAARAGQEGIISMLLAYGADWNAQDLFKKTALHNAIEYKKSNAVVRLLLEWVPDTTIQYAAQKRSQSLRTFAQSQNYPPQLVVQMMPPLEKIAAQEHMAQLETDPLVEPVLKKFDNAALLVAMAQNAAQRLENLKMH